MSGGDGTPFRRLSRAPDLAAIDGLTSLERACRQPLMLGLFLPHQQGAWSPSKAPRQTSWEFDYNADLAIRAEELGFDLVFALAVWLPKGGNGGETQFRANSIDPFIASAALAPLTRNVMLISTVHVLYGWHPLHIAKYGAVIDHISGGRWGINIVTGYKARETRMFGFPQPEHGQRYAMAEEFTELLERLWTEDENIDIDGRWYRMEGAYVSPKPVNGLPVLVAAGSSPAGVDFATRHAEIIFATTTTGADVARACESLPERIRWIKGEAAAKGRDIKVLVNTHVICRPTDGEAQAWRQRILDERDEVALASYAGEMLGGDQASWESHTAHDWAVGGNIHVVGSPETVVAWFQRLQAAGVDGVQINFFDFSPDLDYFAEAVLPLMIEAGLRTPMPGA